MDPVSNITGTETARETDSRRGAVSFPLVLFWVLFATITAINIWSFLVLALSFFSER